MSFPEGELNAQSICDFFNSPLISDQIAGTRNYYCRLPPVSMIFANLDFCLSLSSLPDDVTFNDPQPRMLCTMCDHRGADVRPSWQHG
jgi:hypothetical protein